MNVGELKTSSEKLNYLFKKINWGASFLDAVSIDAMNTYAKDIQREKEEYANSKAIEELEKFKCDCRIYYQGSPVERLELCYRCKRIKELKEVKQS